jgi:acyl-CoA synthetase (AMP-forming)/AMP-acid ligase II
MFVHEILDRARIEHPEAEAVRDAHGSWTYRELGRASDACATWLSEQDIPPGDRVVVRAVADRRVAALLYACSRLGVVFVPLSPNTTPYQLAHVLTDAAPALVVWNGAVATQVPVCPAPGAAGTVPTGPAPANEELPALFFYTSGSVARPKAVVCPHARVCFAARAIAARLGYRPGDVVYCRLPLSFDYGLYQLLLCALGGATLVLADGTADARLLPAGTAVALTRRHDHLALSR